MNSNLILSSTKGMSLEQWLAFRVRGIGASDVGTILGMNQYKAPVQLFYEKLDLYPRRDVMSLPAFMGHFMEDPIAELWEYWGGTVQSMIDNYNNDVKVRRCQRVNAYVQNPKYPWLFVSLDRKINKTANRGEGALEIKNISGREADKWETGIPPSHLVQVQTQIMVCEFDFGELAAKKDSFYFDVWEFERNDKICAMVLERTKDFWDKVEEGRKLITQKYEAERSYNMRLANEISHEIEMLEPEPEGTEAYEKFLKEKFKKSMAEEGLIKGTDIDLATARKLQEVKEKLKTIEAEKLLHENILKRRIGEGKILDFGNEGRVTWQGEPRRFNVKLK